MEYGTLSNGLDDPALLEEPLSYERTPHTEPEREAELRPARAERRVGRLRELTLEVIHAEERERARLARVLHDDLQQLLVAARYSISGVQTTDRAALEQADALLERAIGISRDLSHELTPPILADAGLGPALHWLGRVTGERYDLAVEVLTPDEGPSCGEAIRTLVFRGARELLFNVVKHARTRRAWLTLEGTEGEVVLTVCDAGVGMSHDQQERRGYGLWTLQDRADALGGRLVVESPPGEGVTVTLVVPSRVAATAPLAVDTPS